MTTEDTVLEGELVDGEMVLEQIDEEETPTQTLALISEARHALAEAKTLPDFRRLMEAAAVYSNMAQRQARLMQAQGLAVDVVRQASEAANDAAAVKIEAQVGAGRILRQMREAGELLTHSDAVGRRKDRRQAVPEDGTSGKVSVSEAIGIDSEAEASEKAVARAYANLWERVADVPDNIRVEYIDKMKEEDGDITTKGLLRYAAEPKPEPDQAEIMDLNYGEVTKALATIVKYDPGIIAGHASNKRQKGKLRKLLTDAGQWISVVEAVYMKPVTEPDEE